MGRTRIKPAGGLQIFTRRDDGAILSSESTLTKRDMERGIKLEEHTAILDRYLDETDGQYGWQGVLSRGGNLTVPKAATKEGLSVRERAERVRARMERNEPVLLISYDTATETPIFAEEDQEAYEAGYICPHCMQYQQVPNAPECNWLRKRNEGTPNDPRDAGCGYRRYS